MAKTECLDGGAMIPEMVPMDPGDERAQQM
jgi:hypothetical protein